MCVYYICIKEEPPSVYIYRVGGESIFNPRGVPFLVVYLSLIPSPHLLVLATSERFLLAGGTFRTILANESHWLQQVLVFSVHWWPTPTYVGRELYFQGVLPLCPERRHPQNRLEHNPVRSKFKSSSKKMEASCSRCGYADESFVVWESFEPIFDHLCVRKWKVVTFKKSMCDVMVWRCWLPWQKRLPQPLGVELWRPEQNLLKIARKYSLIQ